MTSRSRCAAALVALAVLIATTLAAAPGAAADGNIWAECISGSVAQECQAASWYTAPVEVVWRASPSPEATTPCLLGIEYPFETDSVPNLACTAKWKASGTVTRELAVHVEVSSPSSEATASRAPDSNGWYNHPVAIAFKGKGYSGPASCQASNGAPTVTYSGPDASNTGVDATCVDPAGKSVHATFALRYDATPPTITGAFPTRAPDFQGWYNHPVTFVFTGTDAVSGMEPCSATYAGPDSGNAQLVGTCRDGAGNVATYTIPLHYEATPPALAVADSSGDGFVSLHWQSHAAVEIARSPGLHGSRPSTLYAGSSGTYTDTRCHNGVRYSYTIKAKGRAGATTLRSLAVTPGPHLLAPAPNALLTAPPLLRWTSVKNARYYNVQLFRGSKRLSAWPVQTSLRLTRSWSYNGVKQHLAPGRYTWYVWPGYGSFGAARYGNLIGRGTFVIRAR